MQKACVSCHGAALKLANNSHPAKKFTDPRNADRLAKLNATLCVTCHREHQPEITGAMGVTLPGDYCFLCHQDIGKERPSHKGLPFSGCTAAGCHNFHDNRAIYEDFLVKHAGEPDIKMPAVIACANPGPAPGQKAGKPLARDAADAAADKLRRSDHSRRLARHRSRQGRRQLQGLPRSEECARQGSGVDGQTRREGLRQLP